MVEIIWEEIKRFLKIMGWILMGAILLFLFAGIVVISSNTKEKITPKISIADSVSIYQDTTYKICFIKAKLGNEFYTTQIACDKVISSSVISSSVTVSISSKKAISSSSVK